MAEGCSQLLCGRGLFVSAPIIERASRQGGAEERAQSLLENAAGQFRGSIQVDVEPAGIDPALQAIHAFYLDPGFVEPDTSQLDAGGEGADLAQVEEGIADGDVADHFAVLARFFADAQVIDIGGEGKAGGCFRNDFRAGRIFGGRIGRLAATPEQAEGGEGQVKGISHD